MARKKGGESRQFATRAIHAGQEPETATGAITVPIYQTSTFAQSAPGVHKGYDYSRTDNPTRTALQTALASLESTEYCLAFSSGMGAATTAMLLFKRGDHVVSSRDVYGGTYRLLQSGVAKLWAHVFLRRNLQRQRNRTRRDSAHPPCVDRVADQPRFSGLPTSERPRKSPITTVLSVWLTTPSRRRFSSGPLSSAPILSFTRRQKYLAGHADVVGEPFVSMNPRSTSGSSFLQNAASARRLSPFDCFLTLRGIKTLALRMREHERTRCRSRGFCRSMRVYGESIIQGSTITRAIMWRLPKMDGFSGIVSFEVKEGLARSAPRSQRACACSKSPRVSAASSRSSSCPRS